MRSAQDAGERFFRLRSPVEQYLVRSRRTLFKEMVFSDLKRLQIDIETTGLDPQDPESQIIVVALKSNVGLEEVLSLQTNEVELLERVTERLRELDPDVIEGHNLFNFDLPFMAARAERFGLALRWGRDGSSVRIGAGVSRFKAGALTMPYTPAYIHGRHIIDTYQQIQRYDIGGHLSSYGSEAGGRGTRSDAAESGVCAGAASLPRSGGTTGIACYVMRSTTSGTSRSLQPCHADRVLSNATLATVVPGCRHRRSGEKLNDLMLRVYLMDGHSVPTAETSRGYAGGHAELLATGVFRPVVKCDVESLYPSIMLSEGITSSRDTLGAYLPMLAELTRRRLEAKAESRRAIQAGQEAERAMWEGMQGSFKVLINSFYGYLGYSGGLFNDYDAAERVTLAGQRIVKQVVANLQHHGATPIEVDTDGVYFVPPSDVDLLGVRASIHRRVSPPISLQGSDLATMVATRACCLYDSRPTRSSRMTAS